MVVVHNPPTVVYMVCLLRRHDEE